MEPHSPEKFLVENWVRFHSQQTHQSEPQNDDDEALSLCHLSTNEHQKAEANHPQNPFSNDLEKDFDFGGANLPENQMCSADELFLRGHILPLRHSVTLPSEFMSRTREFTRSISSEPASVASSRSSSTRSQNSGSSGSSSASRSEFIEYKPSVGNRTRNQFHSHPSPTPQIRTQSYRHSNPKPSSKWRLLQLGPLRPQEMELADLKNRRQRSHGGSIKEQNRDQIEKKKRQILLFGGCECSANVVESIVVSRIPLVKVKPTTLREEEETKLIISKERTVGVSIHRTSEW